MKKKIKINKIQLYDIIKESVKKILNEANTNTITYYHGGDLNDKLFYNNELWLCEEHWYAYIYSKNTKNPVIWEIVIDNSNLNLADLYDLDDSFNPYDGIDDDTMEFLNDEGYDGYYFDLRYNGYYNDCIVLKDNKKVKSIRQLSKDEYESAKIEAESIENND